MEFFERAHVKRNNEKKDTKSDLIMKKQIKQMLHGYKENDNKLIKTCVRCKSEICDSRQCFDDSSSVSGFSDLNLTNSSGEVDVNQITLHSQFESDFSKETEGNVSKCSSNLNDGLGESIMDSISEFSDNIESLSVDSQDVTDNLVSKEHMDTDQSFVSEDNLSSNLTFDDSQVSFSSSSHEETLASNLSESEEFDPEGTLASKILQKLNMKDKILSKKGRKRKLENRFKQNTSDVESFTDSIKPESIVHNPKRISSDSDDEYVFHENYLNYNKDHASEMNDNTSSKSEENSFPDSVSDQSSPYISITAMNTPNKSLSDILGEYRHPTVKNLPFEKQTLVKSKSRIFSTEDMCIEEADVDEEVSSLIPELDDDQTLQDLELPTDNVTTEPLEESTSVYDTIISESTERQSSQDVTDNIEQANSVKVYTHKNTCIFVIKHPGRLYVHGKVKVKALGGTVEVFGYTLKDEWSDLYAPNYSYAQCLKTIETENAYHGLFSKLTDIGLSVSNVEEIVTVIGEYDGVVAMCPLDDRKMDFVDNNFIITDLFEKQSKDIESTLKQASELLACSLYLIRPWRVLETHPVWDDVVACGLESQSRGIVCGGKGTGKSTFLRYCVNKLLAQGPVLVIDVDPGQAEFTVPGNISATVVYKPLLGVNFTNIRKPDRMLNIGMINTMDKPLLYIEALNSLITYCKNQEQFKSIPWIVNTMGMCNNIGLKFITYIIILTQPTYLLQIDSKKAKRRFESDLDQESITRLYHTSFENDYLFKNIEIPVELTYTFFVSPPAESLKNIFTLAPRDERYLKFLAYFGELLNIHSGCMFLDIVPYEVNLKDLNVITNVSVPVDSIAKVLNGKIVALCQHETDTGKIATHDKPLLCVGHGLIRGVDSGKGVLYILTPTPAAVLCGVNTIVYSDWVPELRGQEKNLPAGLAVPYRTAARYSQRQLMVTPRRRFNPIQFLKMSRSS